MKRVSMVMGVGTALCLVAAVATAETTQTNYDIGKVAGSELKIGLGPRPVAMGESFVGLANDLNALAWNAAGLSQIKGYQAGFMHNIYLQETSLEYLAYAQNLFPGAGIGANVMILNFGKMDKVNEVNGLPEVVGDFTPMVFSGSVGYGQWIIPELAVGAAVKFISQSIDNQGYSAVAGDLGLLVKPGIQGLQLGFTVQNVGSKLADADLPLNAKAGLAYSLPVKFSANDVWHFLADVNVPFGDTKYTSGNIGTEYWYNNLVAVRLGYKIKDQGDLGGITGLTAGAGVKLPLSEALAVNVDYAMLSYGDLGMTHQIAFAVNF